MFWIIYNISLKSYAQALLYGFNLIMAVVGFIKWKDKPAGCAKHFEIVSVEDNYIRFKRK